MVFGNIGEFSLQNGPPPNKDTFLKIVELDHTLPPSSSLLYALGSRTRWALSGCFPILFLAAFDLFSALSC
jgi:hypothetical protein